MSLPKDFPSYDVLIEPTFLAIKELGGSANNEEIIERLMLNCKFPEEFQNYQHNKSQSVLEYRAAWARTYLKIAGYVSNSGQRGVWYLTEKGASAAVIERAAIVADVQKRTKKSPKLELVENLGMISGEGDESRWKESLLDFLISHIKPEAFERLSQRLLREAGFSEVRVTGKVGDGGIDGVGILRHGLLSEIVLFQCKRYQGSVGPAAIRDFRGAMQGRSTKGIILTTGTFTAAAKEEAIREGAIPIELIDGSHLCDLLKQYKLGVETKQVEEVSVVTEWFKAV